MCLKSDAAINTYIKTCSDNFRGHSPFKTFCTTQVVMLMLMYPKACIGMTEHDFKSRFNGHTSSIKHTKHANSTALSKHIWELKDKSTKFKIRWSIVKRANAFKAGSKICKLCLAEKLCILNFKYKKYLLNKRSELISKYRHENIFYS